MDSGQETGKSPPPRRMPWQVGVCAFGLMGYAIYLVANVIIGRAPVNVLIFAFIALPISLGLISGSQIIFFLAIFFAVLNIIQFMVMGNPVLVIAPALFLVLLLSGYRYYFDSGQSARN